MTTFKKGDIYKPAYGAKNLLYILLESLSPDSEARPAWVTGGKCCWSVSRTSGDETREAVFSEEFLMDTCKDGGMRKL